MFTNKAADGKNNLCWQAVCLRRMELGMSQRELAEALQRRGLNVDKNAVQRLECGKRFVTDIELVFLSEALGLPITKLVGLE